MYQTISREKQMLIFYMQMIFFLKGKNNRIFWKRVKYRDNVVTTHPKRIELKTIMVPIFGPKTTITEWKTYKNKLTLLICADGKSCDFIGWFRFRWLSSPLASQTIIFSTEQYKSPCNFTLYSAVGEKKKDF